MRQITDEGGPILAAGPAARGGLMPLLLRQALPLLIAAALALGLQDRLASLDTGAIAVSVRETPPLRWLLAGVAAVVSYWAAARYDVFLHRALRTGCGDAEAARAGFGAIALSQTVGFGLVTGALIRWRLLPDLSFGQAVRLTGAVALSFLIGWAVVTGAVLVAMPMPGQAAWLPLAGAVALALGGVVLAAGWHAPGLRFGLRLPAPGAMIALLVLTAVDCVAAAAVLWLLLPPDLIAFPALLPAFLCAMGAGLVLGTPGGIGPFDMVLLTLAPSLPAEPLVGALLGYRLVYNVLPALIAAAVVIAGPSRRRATPRALAVPASDAIARALVDHAPAAEARILAQGCHSVLSAGPGGESWLYAQTPLLACALFDPLSTGRAGFAASLRAEARTGSRLACLYKLGPRSAVSARAAGWHCRLIAREAVLSPASFTLTGGDRAGLRRKLRKAEAAGVVVSQAAGALPIADMARLASGWAARHGGERGFSMGRFAPSYVAGQKVWLAHHNGQLVGFATFHCGRQDWVLDLMRQTADAPDGTMQALICAAIGTAKDAAVLKLSLAAVPIMPAGRGWSARVARRILLRNGAAGLIQFKAGFAPTWLPRYAAAGGPLRLVVALALIWRAIRWPGPLPADAPLPDTAALAPDARWPMTRTPPCRTAA